MLGGIGDVHSKRRHCGGRPERSLRVAVLPRISTCAEPSTTTSTVHFPWSGLPPPAMTACRERPCANIAEAKAAPIETALRMRIFIQSPLVVGLARQIPRAFADGEGAYGPGNPQGGLMALTANIGSYLRVFPKSKVEGAGAQKSAGLLSFGGGAASRPGTSA